MIWGSLSRAIVVLSTGRQLGGEGGERPDPPLLPAPPGPSAHPDWKGKGKNQKSGHCRLEGVFGGFVYWFWCLSNMHLESIGGHKISLETPLQIGSWNLMFCHVTCTVSNRKTNDSTTAQDLSRGRKYLEQGGVL